MMRTSAFYSLAGRRAALRVPFSASILGFGAPHQRLMLTAARTN